MVRIGGSLFTRKNNKVVISKMVASVAFSSNGSAKTMRYSEKEAWKMKKVPMAPPALEK